MRYSSKEEFAKAIIDAGEDGLVCDNTRAYFNEIFNDPFRMITPKKSEKCMITTWNRYNEDWQPYVKPIPDKALVWCWDNEDNAMRSLRAYDSHNKCAFTHNGYRDGRLTEN